MGPFFLGAALIPQWTATACCFGCFVYLRAHTVLAVLHHMESESFAGGTEVDIVLSVVRKRTTDKRSTAAVGVKLQSASSYLARNHRNRP